MSLAILYNERNYTKKKKWLAPKSVNYSQQQTDAVQVWKIV